MDIRAITLCHVAGLISGLYIYVFIIEAIPFSPQSILVVWSLGNKPDESEGLWTGVTYCLSFISIGAIALVIWQAPAFSVTVLLSGLGAIGVFAIMALLHGKVRLPSSINFVVGKHKIYANVAYLS